MATREGVEAALAQKQREIKLFGAFRSSVTITPPWICMTCGCLIINIDLHREVCPKKEED